MSEARNVEHVQVDIDEARQHCCNQVNVRKLASGEWTDDDRPIQFIQATRFRPPD